jgi:hypothetical protein
MLICNQTGSHIGQAKQFDLEHFIFIVARCARCYELLETKTIVKEDKQIQ